MAKIKITRGNGEDAVDCETSVIVAIPDAGEDGTKATVVIEEATTIKIAALLDLVDTITERYPAFRVKAEAARQARDIEKEEGKTDD